MRIEDITELRLKKLNDKILGDLHSRISQIYDKYFYGNSKKIVHSERVGIIYRNEFLEKYKILMREMRKRKSFLLEKTNIDRALFKQIFLGIDSASLGDVAIVNDYISIGGSYVRNPKSAEDVDVIVRDIEENRDEGLELKIGRLIEKETNKLIHFVYAPKGPHSSYVPLFDLVLRPKEETKKIEVKEGAVKAINVKKWLTVEQKKELEEENEKIKENEKKPKAKEPHEFKQAKFTHPNGHPRCLICGDEEPIGKVCNMPDSWYDKHEWDDEKSWEEERKKLRNSRVLKSDKEYYEQLDNWDKELKKDNSEVVKRLESGSVLDLGCGTGKLMKILEGSGRMVEGVDNNDTALDHCKKRGLKVHKLDLDKDDLPFEPHSFDNVICVHTFEHLENPDKLIKDSWIIAKKRIVILSPLGKRLDLTHKQTFEKLEDFKKWFGDVWDVEKIEETNSGIAVLDQKKVKKSIKEWEEKRGLIPFGTFVPPKPTMAGLTEAFSVEQVWKWVEKNLPVDVEEKLNGFRCVIEKAGDRVRIKTEGNKDRTKQFSEMSEKLSKIPDDFILDCSMGIDRKGKPLPRIELMTLMADEPELEEGDIIKATVFDIPYWKEDFHEKPLKERRKLLESFYSKYLKGPQFELTNFIQVNDKKGLETQFRKLSKLPQSEGIMIKTLDGIWDTDGKTSEWAKLKREAEIKVIVIEKHQATGGNYNYTCGVLKGDSDYTNMTRVGDMELINLGKTFNTKIQAKPGDILTIGVEEIIPREEKLVWLGGRVLDVDKDRKAPYFADQVVEIARGANILQKKEEGKEFGNIDYEVGDKGTGVFQVHIMGIEEGYVDKLKQASNRLMVARGNLKTLESTLKSVIGEQACHIDMRLQKGKTWQGGEIMVGNISGLSKLSGLERGKKMRFAWKQSRVGEPEIETIRGPLNWIDAGSRKVEIFEPGEVGALANTWAGMIRIDKFNWEMYLADEHAKKIRITGSKFFDGNWLFAYVPVGEKERVWMISKLKDDDHIKKVMVKFKKINKKEYIVGGIVVASGEVDTQGDVIEKKEVWKALKNWMLKGAKVKVMHRGREVNIKVVECYQADETHHKGGTRPEHIVKKGDWWISLYLGNTVGSRKIFQEIVDGKLNAFSIGGTATAQ